VAVITEDAIRELAAFRSQDAPVVSCYLDVDGRSHPRPQDLDAELGRVLRAAREQTDGSGAATDLGRIEAFVRGGLDRSSTRGLAIFACSAHDLWRVFTLPVPVRSHVVVNAMPAVGQLESVVQELERLGVLLVDRQRARMFVFHTGELVDRSELFEALPRAYDTRGQSDAGYEREQHHVDELAVQHLRQAVGVAFDLFQQQGFERLTIGAPQDLRPTVESLLHPYLRERLGPPVQVPVTASVDEVGRASIEVERQVEREREARQVERLRAEVGRNGRGVAGLDATLAALSARRIERLFVSDGYRDSGWHCERCGHLCHVGPSCPVDGESMRRVDDVVEEAIEIALGQSCRVEVCVGNADLDVLGRIGGLLRY